MRALRAVWVALLFVSCAEPERLEGTFEECRDRVRVNIVAGNYESSEMLQFAKQQCGLLRLSGVENSAKYQSCMGESVTEHGGRRRSQFECLERLWP